MELQSLTPNLMVEDVEETIKYYEDVLGFTTIQTVPIDGKLAWGMIKRNEVVMMFQSKRSMEDGLTEMQGRKPGGGLTLYIKMDGVQEWFEEIQEDAEVVAEIEETFYETLEFSIMDLNGYVITFAEDLEKSE